MSFFDDGEDTAPRPSARAPRSNPIGVRSGGPAPRRPRPRRPAGAGGPPAFDQHSMMVRRRVAAGVAVALLIIIVLVINGCLKSQVQQSLKDYNRHVGEIAQEYEAQVARPLFTSLTGASSKPALNVESQINQLLLEAQKLNRRASELSVPGEMTGAQRALLLALGLRVEGISKVAAELPAALGGQSRQVAPKIAGAMETFLASDVIYSQRVAPLIEQELSAKGISASTAGARFLPNLGWLETNTVLARLAGATGASSSTTSTIAPGTHGSALTAVAVGTNTLEGGETLNHIKGGTNPAFTVTVENTGSNPETNVKVDVTVTTAGQQRKDARVINSTQAGAKVNVEVPVLGVPLGVASKIEVEVEAVPGETETENNKGTYLAIFSE